MNLDLKLEKENDSTKLPHPPSPWPDRGAAPVPTRLILKQDTDFLQNVIDDLTGKAYIWENVARRCLRR